MRRPGIPPPRTPMRQTAPSRGFVGARSPGRRLTRLTHPAATVHSVGTVLPRPHPRGATMTDVILFHHAQGLTAGVRRFADQLRAAGHHVAAPDLYDGATFKTLDDGIGYAEQVGFDTIIKRGQLAAESLPTPSSMPDSHSACCPHRAWPRLGRARRGRCCFMPACRPPSSAAHGRRASRSRSTRWKPTSCSSPTASSTSPAISSPRPRTRTIGPGERSILVVFTTYPQHTSWPQGTTAISRLCRSLSPLVPDAPPSVSHLPLAGLRRVTATG